MLQTLCKDPILQSLIQKFGHLHLEDNPMQSSGNLFFDLVHIIVRQQLSNKAADRIWQRVNAYFKKDMTPNRILQAKAESLTGLGLSFNKMHYIQNLAQQVQSNLLDLESLQFLKDTDVLDKLTKVKGIGKWSGQCFLMFSLKRTDIFLVEDLGIQKAIQNLYANGEKLSTNQLLQIAEQWRPYRSFACLYLWKSLENA